MLDIATLTGHIEQSLPDLFAKMDTEHQALKHFFAWCQEHPEGIERLKNIPGPQPLPQWEGALDKVRPIRLLDRYTVLATDGSQIYPDKHQGVPCYVLNTGSALFSYDTESRVHLSAVPELVTLLDDTISEDMVNCKRAEREFAIGLEKARQITGSPFAFLCDGSLLFWHLETKSKAIKERFIPIYMGLFEQFYQLRIPLAGYISLPKSKELIAIARNAERLVPELTASYETQVDTDLVSLFLPAKHRTVVFKHNSSLAQDYPDQLVPCFVYLNTGTEIARVEFPAWLAQDSDRLEILMSIILDQSQKGNGYPVSLSEAHEQAVVRSFERRQFFSLLQRLHLKQHRNMPLSQKSLKKRYVSV